MIENVKSWFYDQFSFIKEEQELRKKTDKYLLKILCPNINRIGGGFEID